MIIWELLKSLTLSQVIVGLSTYAVVRIVHTYYDRHNRYQIFKRAGIPGPKPSLWQGNQGENYASGSWHQVAKEWKSKYGKTFGYFVGNMPVLNTCDLDIIQEVFLDRQDVFPNRMKLPIEPVPVNESILINRGERWRITRKLLTPAFNRYRVKGEATKFIDESVEKMLKYLESKFESKNGQPVESIELDVMALMKSTALHLVSEMALHLKNIEIGEKSAYVIQLDNYLRLMSDDNELSPIRWALRLPIIAPIMQFMLNRMAFGIYKQVLDNVAREIELSLKGQGDQGRESSVLTQMAYLYRDGKLTRKEVEGNSLAVLLAGYDTTSHTLSYIFYALSAHTDVQTKLRHELYRDGTDSKYLLMVMNETMRLYNTVIIFAQRQAAHDITIKGIKIEKDVTVMFNSPLIHHDPEIWSDPMRFDPERFAEGKKHHPCAFAPFGMGHKICVGFHLAMLEMKCILTEIITRYDLELIGPKDLHPLKTKAFILTEPLEKIRLRLRRL